MVGSVDSVRCRLLGVVGACLVLKRACGLFMLRLEKKDRYVWALSKTNPSNHIYR
jgi:hypothetical protein